MKKYIRLFSREGQKRPIDWELISKSFREPLEQAEQQELDDWLAFSAEHRCFYEKARQKEGADPEEGLGNEVLTQKKKELIGKARERQGNSRRIRWKWRSYAAVLILPVALAAICWMLLKDKKDILPGNNQIVAGGGQVVLELHNGRTYILDTTRSIETGIEGNTALAGKKELIYARQEVSELVYNKLNVPRGGEYQLSLADGTKVWLNAVTELSYPVAFTGDTRVVYLTGEAYFEVAQDTARPFIVVSGDMQVKVYGTQFNVNTHREGKVQTVLVKGKVGVQIPSTGQETLLQPGQLAEYSLADKSVHVEKVDTYPYTAWKEGEFVFRNETVEEILDRLCLWYDADVFYANEQVKQRRFTGVIRRFADISDVLYLIGETATVDFSIKNKTIIVR